MCRTQNTKVTLIIKLQHILIMCFRNVNDEAALVALGCCAKENKNIFMTLTFFHFVTGWQKYYLSICTCNEQFILQSLFHKSTTS